MYVTFSFLYQRLVSFIICATNANDNNYRPSKRNGTMMFNRKYISATQRQSRLFSLVASDINLQNYRTSICCLVLVTHRTSDGTIISFGYSWKCDYVLFILFPSTNINLRRCNIGCDDILFTIIIVHLTHWGRDKMTTISQTTLSNAFYLMKMLEFWLKFHWNLFLRFQLIIFHPWFI